METVIRKSGIKYREHIYINGKKSNSPYFSRKLDAKAWKRRKIQERDRMLALGITHDIEISLKDYFKKFMTRRTDKARRTKDAYECMFKNHIIPSLGHLKLSQIRLFHGEDLKTSLRDSKQLGSRRINNILNALKILLNDAVKFDYLISSPFKALDFIKVPPKKLNYWLKPEIEQFLRANRNDHYYALYVVAFNLGLRKGELLGIQVSQIDFANNQIVIDHTVDRYGLKNSTKNSEARVLAMNHTVSSILAQHLKDRTIQSEFVFTDKEGEPVSYCHFTERIFYQAVKRAGLRKITFHECRKSFASNFMMSSGDIYALKNLLGHKSVDVTQKTYAHLHPTFLMKQANVVSFSGDNSPHVALKLVSDS